MSESNEPCQSPKRSVGILLYPPSIGAPCDCYTDILFPIGSIASLLRSAGTRFFSKTLLTKALGMLGSKLAPLGIVRGRARTAVKQISQENKRLSLLSDSLKEKLKTLQERLKTIGGELSKALKDFDQSKHMANLWGIDVKKLAIKYNVNVRWENGWPTIMGPEFYQIPASFFNAFDNYIHFKKKLSGLKDLIDSLKAGQKLRLPEEIKLTTQELRAVDQMIEATRPAINFGEEIIPAGTLASQEQQIKNILSRLDSKINEIETLQQNGYNALSSGNSGSMTNALDSITGRFTDIAAAAFGLLNDLLMSLAIMEKINCYDSSMLDESTCLCTKCPPDKDLCSPPAATDPTANLLPQLPGVRMGTELNQCVPKCCPGMVFSLQRSDWNPCACVCDDATKVARPCNNADCKEKLICAGPEPDSGELGFFGTSKYQWNADKCDWECKPGKCTTSTTPPPTTSTTSPPTTSTTSPPTTSTTPPPTTSTTPPPTTSTTTSPTTSTTTSPTTSTTTSPTTSTTTSPTTSTTPPPCGDQPCDPNNPLKRYKRVPWGNSYVTDCNECECIPINERLECGPDSVISSPETCECVCVPLQCEAPKIQDPNAAPPNCSCKCPPCTEENSGLTPDPYDCSCGCPSGPFPVYKCARNPDNMFEPDYVCVECYEGSGTYNATTCSCECNEPCPSPKIHKTPETKNGVVQNPTCQCYCPENDIQCQCEDIFGGQKCSENKEYLYDITLPYKCKCVCKTVLDCGTLKHFDTDTCACVCNNINDVCLFGQVRDPETCLCVTTTTTTPGPTTSTTPSPTTTTGGPTTTVSPTTTGGPTEYLWYCTDC